MSVNTALLEGVSGAVGGIVATVATYPLMMVTTRQATRVREEPAGEGGAPRKRQSTLAEIAEIVHTSGWQSLFGGLGTALFGTTISQGIYFSLYSLLRGMAVERRLEAQARAARLAGGAAAPPRDARSESISVGESLLVAALAGAGNVLITNPIWMIATRMQAQRRVKPAARPKGAAAAAAEEGAEGEDLEDIDLPPPNFLAVCRSVYAEYGLRGFWNGVGASLIMVINPTIQYALYEFLVKARTAARRSAAKRRGSSGPLPRASALEVFLLASLAKAGATVVTYPLLTIKTRMYTAKKGDADMQYRSIADAAVQIVRREGVGGYFKGLNSKIVQSVLAAALLFVCKEKITDFTRAALLVAAARQAPARAVQ